MTLVGVELETLVSETDALTTSMCILCQFDKNKVLSFASSTRRQENSITIYPYGAMLPSTKFSANAFDQKCFFYSKMAEK